MSGGPKGRILARRGAFVAAALAAACDRCGDKPQPCLSQAVIEDDAETVTPRVCLSAPPHPCLSQVWYPPDAGATIDGGSEGGAITLKPIDISTDAGATPMPCLSMVAPTPSPKPRVCLRRLE